MDALVAFEKHLGVKLPPTYRTFAEHGYLTYPGRRYLYVHEAEWIPLSKMTNQRALPPAHTLNPGFIAFAHSGGGDLWCWQTLRPSEGGEYPIAFCPRDSDWGQWHAPNFIGWLYRTSLESVAPFGGDEDEPLAKKRLHRWAGLIREFGHPEWAADVEAVGNRAATPLKLPRGEDSLLRVLLTEEEVASRVRQAFGDEYLNADFVYDVHGERPAE